MRSLWAKYGSMKTGYTHNSYKKIIEDLTNRSFDWYFDDLIFGTEDLLPYLDKSLKSVGCYIREEKNELINERLFGFRLENNKIIKISQKSPAENLLRIGDELSLIEKNLPENHIWSEETRSIRISIIRLNEILNLTIKADHEFYFNQYTINKMVTADDIQKRRFENWLHHKH
jgi:predicted metalloprotease with PDZ domain